MASQTLPTQPAGGDASSARLAREADRQPADGAEVPGPSGPDAARGAGALSCQENCARVRRLGDEVWSEMAGRGVAPTPLAYEVWFTHRAGTHPALTQRLGAALEQPGRAIPMQLLESLHSEFLDDEQDSGETLLGCADEMRDAAGTLAEQVAGSRAEAQAYGESLAHWSRHLHVEPGMERLVGVLATLTAQTAEAMERNRELERQLAESGSRLGKLRQSLSAMRQETVTDALTGIGNRRAFDARLRRVLAQARAGSGGGVSLLLLDVDHFKRFNDSYGHRTGDLVLRLVARLLTENVKGRDMVARYGGEEFAVLLVDADLRAATVVARQICQALGSKQLVTRSAQRQVGRVTVSAGVAQLRAGDTMGSVVERADAALYRAKDRGRNQVCTEAELAHAGARAGSA